MDTMGVPDWKDLAARVRTGDQSAQRELFTFLYPRVFAMALVRLRDPELARDVAQDTLLSVWSALWSGAIREPGRLDSYVLGTARNLIANLSRRISRHPPPLPLSDQQPEARPGPEELATHRERIRALREAMRRLNPLERRILRMTLVDGMTPREIAPVVGLRQEIVRVRKCRAIQRVVASVASMIRTPSRDHLQDAGKREAVVEPGASPQASRR